MARSHLLATLIVLFTVALVLSHCSSARGPEYPRITVSLVDRDVEYALTIVTAKVGGRLESFASYEGKVNLYLEDTPWEQAVEQILAESRSLSFEVREDVESGPALGVAPTPELGERCQQVRTTPYCAVKIGIPENAVRAQFLLQYVEATEVLDFLEGEHHRVKFEAHPTLNGFYAYGSTKDLQLVREEVRKIDQQTRRQLLR